MCSERNTGKGEQRLTSTLSASWEGGVSSPVPAQPPLMWGHGTARTVCRSQLWRLPQTRPSSQKLPAEPGMARCPRPRAPGRSPTGRSLRPGTRALPPGLLHLPEPRHGCGCHVGAAQPSCLQVTSAWGRPHWSRTPRPAAHRAGPTRPSRGFHVSEPRPLRWGRRGRNTGRSFTACSRTLCPEFSKIRNRIFAFHPNPYP